MAHNTPSAYVFIKLSRGCADTVININFDRAQGLLRIILGVCSKTRTRIDGNVVI